jgi:hypothetical protein
MRQSLSIAALVLVALLSAPVSSHTSITTPVSLQGVLDGAPYTINIPDAWNGTLVMYEDGYRAIANVPGETEDRAARFRPPELEQFLLSQGYATAASAFTANGYNIEEGIEDTRALMHFIKQTIGTPQRAILLGRSGGSVRNNVLLESGQLLFDGAIDTCGISTGTPLFFDRSLDFAVAYDAAFGWPSAWGTPGDVRDDLDFARDIQPVFLPQLLNRANFGRWEFIRTVTGLPLHGFYNGPSSLFTNMFFTTEARAQLDVKLGAVATQNLDHHYALSAADTGFLSSLGVDAGPLLSAMNAHTIYGADKAARKYVERWAEFSGKIRAPILSLHAIEDGLATVDGESVLADLTREAGRDHLLTQVFTDGVGHCTFTLDQLVTTFQAMESWLNTGTRPGDALFPASQGFVHGFQPPPWPQPVR